MWNQFIKLLAKKYVDASGTEFFCIILHIKIPNFLHRFFPKQVVMWFCHVWNHSIVVIIEN